MLEIERGFCVDAYNANVVALFLPLQELQQLIVKMGMGSVPLDPMRALSESLPHLRHLKLNGLWCFNQAVEETAGKMHLFRSLIYLAMVWNFEDLASGAYHSEAEWKLRPFPTGYLYIH